MLEIIDRHAAVLHLPLTFTLAEASRRLLKATAERSGRPADTGLHSDALRGARSALVFSRPRGGGGGGAGGAGGVADVAARGNGGGGGRGGWCAFGDEIMSAFDRVCGGDGGDSSAEVRKAVVLLEEACCMYVLAAWGSERSVGSRSMCAWYARFGG